MRGTNVQKAACGQRKTDSLPGEGPRLAGDPSRFREKQGKRSRLVIMAPVDKKTLQRLACSEECGGKSLRFRDESAREDKWQTLAVPHPGKREGLGKVKMNERINQKSSSGVAVTTGVWTRGGRQKPQGHVRRKKKLNPKSAALCQGIAQGRGGRKAWREDCWFSGGTITRRRQTAAGARDEAKTHQGKNSSGGWAS